MKRIFVLSVIFCLMATFTFAAKQTVLFKAKMDCGSCKQKVEKTLSFEKGVKALEVNLEKQTISVTFDNEKTTVEKLQAAINKTDVKAQVVKNCSKDANKCCSNKPAEQCCKNNPNAKPCSHNAETKSCGQATTTSGCSKTCTK